MVMFAEIRTGIHGDVCCQLGQVFTVIFDVRQDRYAH